MCMNVVGFGFFLGFFQTLKYARYGDGFILIFPSRFEFLSFSFLFHALLSWIVFIGDAWYVVALF